MNTGGKNLPRIYQFRNVAERLQHLITQRDVSPGDRLPAERQLAADLQVSRSSVREALRVLEQKDLVEIRRGTKGGAYVKAPSHRQLSEGMDILLRFNQLSLDQIAEFREQIEGGVTALAAGKANADDLRMLKHRLEAAQSFLGKGCGGVDGFIEADKAIHLCVAQIAGNPLFTQALKALLGLRQYFCRFLKLDPSFMEADYADLSGIVQAMENRQPETAVSITQAHISRFNKLVA
jgi:DNA-binding FadR family transcriptional regulator